MNNIIASDKARFDSWPMYRALMGLGCLCGLLLASVFLLTQPAIQRKQAQSLERAIVQVLPGTRFTLPFKLDANGKLVPANIASAQNPVFASYNAQGDLLGMAITAEGMGYQDVIRLLYGYQPQTQTIVGMRVLASKETPGLGDKITVAPFFLANFSQLDVGLNSAGDALAHAITLVKQGQKNKPWEMDGITGATISSKAVTTIVNDSAQRWLAPVQRQLNVLQRAGAEHVANAQQDGG